MAKLVCKCGELMSNSSMPNDIQYWVYSDIKMDEICSNDTIDVAELIANETYEVWLCAKCNRLYVFENDSAATKYVYQLEEVI